MTSKPNVWERMYENQWEPPVASEWVEREFGRHTFGNLWEAYAGGCVIDVYARQEAAADAHRETRRLLLSIVRDRDSITFEQGLGLIAFANGGAIWFVTAYDIALRGLARLLPTRPDGSTVFPTRIDGRVLLDRRFVYDCEASGIEAI